MSEYPYEPWSALDEGQHGWSVNDRDGYLLASAPSGAIARLWAAAPDLLAACQAAQRYDAAIQEIGQAGRPWVNSEELDQIYDAWIAAVNVAVARVTGEPPP